MSRAFICGVWCLVMGQVAVPKAEDTEGRAASEAAIAAFKEQAAAYQFQIPSMPEVTLALVKTPLLHWGNPARTGEDGAVFVWVAEGRPQVIGSIFTYRLSEVFTKHEFQSLSTEPLTATFRDQAAWAPAVAGVKYAAVPEASAPAANARARGTQMRQMARQFSARLTDLEDKSAELRLMPNPLYRHEVDGKGDVLDGAIFAFALGTDPEVLLVLEARRSDSGPRWEYALARFHYVNLWATHNGKEVWHVEADTAQPSLQLGAAEHQRKTYISYHVK